MSTPLRSDAAPASRRVAYDFAVLRVVPHVYLGTFVNVGVVLHARTEEYLGIRVIAEREALRTIAPDVDTDLLARYLTCYIGICNGDASAGQIALLPPSERFHWITAPRSDVLQTSPVHGGLAVKIDGVLDELYRELVGD